MRDGGRERERERQRKKKKQRERERQIHRAKADTQTDECVIRQRKIELDERGEENLRERILKYPLLLFPANILARSRRTV